MQSRWKIAAILGLLLTGCTSNEVALTKEQSQACIDAGLKLNLVPSLDQQCALKHAKYDVIYYVSYKDLEGVVRGIEIQDDITELPRRHACVKKAKCELIPATERERRVSCYIKCR